MCNTNLLYTFKWFPNHSLVIALQQGEKEAHGNYHVLNIKSEPNLPGNVKVQIKFS